MNKYYLTIKGKIEGPYTVDDIHDMINLGTVQADDLCWTSGMFDWRKISACMPGLNTAKPLTKILQSAQLFSEKEIRQHFVAFTILWCISYPLYIINLQCILINLLLICAFILALLLIYRHWILLQESYARITPEKAILFLFIPFFNLYWFFVAIVGLAEDSNLYMNEFLIKKKRISHKLALAYYVAILMGLLFTIKVLYVYGNIAMDTMYLSNAKDYMLYNLSKMIDFAIMVLGYFFAHQQREAILAIIKHKKGKLKVDNLREILTK